MQSITTEAQHSIQAMAGEPKVSVRLHNPISESTVEVLLRSGDTQDEIKAQLQESLGVTPDYVILKHEGEIVEDGDIDVILSLPTEKREMTWEENLDGGLALGCVGVNCCLSVFNGPRPSCYVSACCFHAGDSPYTKGSHWGAGSNPFAFRMSVSCCRICSVWAGEPPGKRLRKISNVSLEAL